MFKMFYLNFITHFYEKQSTVSFRFQINKSRRRGYFSVQYRSFFYHHADRSFTRNS